MQMNTHDTMSVSLEFMGETLRVSQDPNTEHLGTSVWDASIVLAKFLEKNMRKGAFARTKIAGKRVLELGSGMGLGGIAMSLMGADVTLTDTVDVLPLLRRNCELNLGKGKAHVCELNWMKPEQAQQWAAPFDFVIAADCIYHEHIVPYFHAIVMATTNEKSTVLVVNELRSHSVHAAFMDAFTPTHTVTRLSNKLMHDTYQHENIQMFLCKRKRYGAKGGTKEDQAVSAEEDAGANSLQEDAGANPLQEDAAANPLQGDARANPFQKDASANSPREDAGANSLQEDARENSLQEEEAPKLQAESVGHQGQGQQAHDSLPQEGEHCSEPKSEGEQRLTGQERTREKAESSTSALASRLQHVDIDGGPSHLGNASAQAAKQAASEQWAARRTGAAIAQILGAVHVPTTR
ncbi:putative methyltransferase-domain-containing protein [Dunaliella salina]|uniref:Methyltransferase-domain-containing protein n=1 Tax=Dunaliella salina TaxID=3046 RepID=A0ABQ7G8Q0_DUNSA|nr:putative methyltransferase-domain-containing protein [Dunaliella salina]|eukprot:KAF5830984.1 putative methyltransferase-domain-containing protein [Dunaliella salina]